MQDFLIAIDHHQPLWILVAFVFGFGMRLLGLPPLIGFLIAGFALKALGAVDSGFLHALADLGVTLLLFSIGLKLDLRSLLQPQVWGVTSLHLAASSGLIGLLILFVGSLGVPLLVDLDWSTALLIAFALSFSSTVFAVKVLEDSGEMASRYGRLSIGVLIVQDLAAVAFLAISSGKIPSLWALALFALIPARHLLIMVLKRVGHGELLILYGVMLALGGAALFEIVGMKGDLGALVIGALIGTHPKASELAKSLLGFKELFLVGFFLSVGMGELPGLTELLIAIGLVLLLPLKTALFFALFTRFKVRARTSTMASLSLGNFSEFGLIVAAVAMGAGWLEGSWLTIIAIALSLSFLLAAPLNEKAEDLYYRRRSYLKRFETEKRLVGEDAIPLPNIKVAIFGMGRVGTGAYDALRERFPDGLVGVDVSDSVVAEHRQQERLVIQGDPLDHEFWARVENLKDGLQLVFLAMAQQSENLRAIKILRERGYQGRIAAIAKHSDDIEELKANGVDSAFNLYGEAGAGFASHVCNDLSSRQPAA